MGASDSTILIKCINAVFGTPQHRWFRVEWEDHPGEDSWEPGRSLERQGCKGVIKDFWRGSKLCPSTEFIPDPDDVWRCWCCGKGYSRSSTLKAHITRTHPPRQWHGSSADRDARKLMHEEVQKAKAKVKCEGNDLKNV